MQSTGSDCVITWHASCTTPLTHIFKRDCMNTLSTITSPPVCVCVSWQHHAGREERSVSQHPLPGVAGLLVTWSETSSPVGQRKPGKRPHLLLPIKCLCAHQHPDNFHPDFTHVSALMTVDWLCNPVIMIPVCTMLFFYSYSRGTAEVNHSLGFIYNSTHYWM